MIYQSNKIINLLLSRKNFFLVYTGTPPYVLLGGLGVQEDRDR